MYSTLETGTYSTDKELYCPSDFLDNVVSLLS